MYSKRLYPEFKTYPEPFNPHDGGIHAFTLGGVMLHMTLHIPSSDALYHQDDIRHIPEENGRIES